MLKNQKIFGIPKAENINQYVSIEDFCFLG
jgi:hypothetical protein